MWLADCETLSVYSTGHDWPIQIIVGKGVAKMIELMLL